MFSNMYRAEVKEQKFVNLMNRMSMIPDNKKGQFNTMLSSKRTVRNVTSSTGSLGGILSGLGMNAGPTNALAYRINGCLSAIDRTIDANLMALLGVTLDAAGITYLLQMQSVLGEQFTRLMYVMANIQNYGENALYQLQSAITLGIQNTIFDVVAMGTDLINETINNAADAAFAELMPALSELQNGALSGILGGIGDAAGAVSALLDNITNDLNNLLYTMQTEFNAVSDIISGGLFNYAANKGTTCASRPDSQLGLRTALTNLIR